MSETPAAPAPNPSTYPLHVRVHAVLEPEAVFEIRFPQNVSSPAEDGSLPNPRPQGIWVVRRHLKADHDCPYAWDDDACECIRTWTETVPIYERDWNATGPLIEGLRLTVVPRASSDGWVAAPWSRPGIASVPYGHGSDPLMAICSAVLVMGPAMVKEALGR